MARAAAAERSNSTVKNPASNDISRGGCRLMGLTSMTLMLTCLFVVRNQRVLASFEACQAEDERRQAVGLAPRTRRRRRQTITDLVPPRPTHRHSRGPSRPCRSVLPGPSRLEQAQIQIKVLEHPLATVSPPNVKMRRLQM